MEIKSISQGGVNCYLLEAGDGAFILIDTGFAKNRAGVERELNNAGCHPGNLKLILLTHGDFDHSGNAAHFRKKYGAKVAMHSEDAGMVERGDMAWSRKTSSLARLLFSIPFFKLGKANRFTPDFTVAEGYDLSAYGFLARVIELPGHTRGSIGILAAAGGPADDSGTVLFCGDLLMNGKSGPHLGFGDPADFTATIEKLKGLDIHILYPGHGEPFTMEQIAKGAI
jgi:hydroxyacylglutathione hydrolase